MHQHTDGCPCGSDDHFSRRTLLKRAGWSGLAWLSPVARALARAEERAPRGAPARSVIILWLAGGPSQLDTFDPHPAAKSSTGVKAIKTAARGVELAEGFGRLAEVMGEVSLIRSMVSREADHERAVYNMNTGYRPVPTVVHPSIGAIVCHELTDTRVDIPRHISLLPGQWPSRGGYFGPQYDAFQAPDPVGPVQDVAAPVPPDRQTARLKDLDVVEGAFHQGRAADLEARTTLQQANRARALKIMGSDQLAAFNVLTAPAAQRAAYGDSPFGRGCLAALRLVETGVRCVEVTLDGWDTHANNHDLQRKKVDVLDPAFTALLGDLKERGLLDSTVVLCGGEFGRTPKVNVVGGRDHWPYGFSVALAGGGIRGGRVLGASDPEGESKEPSRPVMVADLHATIQTALGVNPEKEIITPVGRPIALSEGSVIPELLAG